MIRCQWWSRTTASGSSPQHARDDGLGLLGMRERVALLGGRMAIESRSGSAGNDRSWRRCH